MKKNFLKFLIRKHLAEKIKPKAKAEYKQFGILNTLNGNFNDFENFLYNCSSTVGIILGARGKGKTAIGLKTIENIHAKTEKKVFALGFKKNSLPKWIKNIQSIEEAENNSFLLVDEGGVEFSSRNSMSKINKLFSELLFISRHKDLSILLVSQNSANLEVNAIRQADYLMLKPSALLQSHFERKKIQDIYQELEEGFQKFKSSGGLACIYSDQFVGFVENTLPTFWSDRISKAFDNFGGKK